MSRKAVNLILKIAKLLVVNFFVFLSLLLVFNTFCIIFFEAKKNYNKKSTQFRVQRELGNTPDLKVYKEMQWGDLFFKEFFNLKTEYRSFVGWRRLPFSGQTINIDANGIRRTHKSMRSACTTSKKIALLGGSTVWGTGVNDSSTIASLINLSSEGCFEVQNFGESGYNAFQSTIFLSTQMHNGFKPDIIITYDGVNNSPDFFERFFSHHREKQMIQKMKDADFSINNEFTVKQYLFGPTIAMMNYAKSVFSPRVKNNRNAISDSLAAIYLLESWLATNSLAKDAGAKFMCILQPNIYVGSPVITEKLHYARFSYSYYKNVVEFLERDRYRILKENFLNFTDIFDGKENIYIDFCHVGPSGNKIIAERILTHLTNELQPNKVN